MKSRMKSLSGRPLAACVCAVLTGCFGAALAATASTAVVGPLTVSASPPFEWVKVRENFYVVSGPDGNVAVQLGADGAVVVDTQRAALGTQLVTELKKIVGQGSIRFLINTSGDAGHAGANEQVRNAGRQIAGPMLPENIAAHLAHQNVVLRLAESGEGAYPAESYITDLYDFHFNDEGIKVIHAPAAHSNGDSLVYFPRSDVIVTGEVWNTLTYPVIDTRNGGSIQGELDALNKLIDIAVPREMQEGGTVLVPGRGRVGDESDVADYRDMVTIIRDRIKAMAAKGMTLEQVKSAKPTYDYDARWGATSGPWTTDMFIAAVYEGVKARRPQSTGDSK